MTFFVAPYGSDANCGTSTSSPWQHAPKDRHATGNSAAYARAKKLVIVLVILLLTLPAFAQAPPPHQNTLNWAASPSALKQPTLVYNVYTVKLAPGSTCPTTMTPTLQTLLATVGPNVLTYVDSANLVDAGVSCYEVTAAAFGFESPASNEVQTVSPLVLAAPSGLNVIKQ